MKLLFLALLLPLTGRSQDIPKFSNTILVKGVTFKQAKSALLDSAYFIDQQNEQDGTIVTKPKGFEKNDVRTLIIYVRVKDSVARITGAWNNNFNYRAQSGGLGSVDKTQFHPVEYWKSSISVQHFAFLQLDRYARSLGGEITYAKQ